MLPSQVLLQFPKGYQRLFHSVRTSSFLNLSVHSSPHVVALHAAKTHLLFENFQHRVHTSSFLNLVCTQFPRMLPKLHSCLETFSTQVTISPQDGFSSLDLHRYLYVVPPHTEITGKCKRFLEEPACRWVDNSTCCTSTCSHKFNVDGQIPLHIVHLHALINLQQSRSFCNRIHKVSQNLLLFTSRASVSKYYQEVFLSFYHNNSPISITITVQEPIIPRILDVL